ncbi:MAG: hypothetical protein ACK5MU_02890 [Candidatus Saccharimonadales bacterium]
MNSGERLNNNQETREKSREENIKLIEDMPAIPLLIEMGIAAIDIYNGNMDDDTINDLRARLEDRLANPAPVAETPAETPAEDTAETGSETAEPEDGTAETGTPAEEEGPEIVPPVVPAGMATGEETGTEGGDEEETPAEGGEDTGEETGEDDPESGDGETPEEGESTEGETDPEETPEQPVANPEKKKSFWTRNRRIGAAVLAVITTVTVLAGSIGMMRNNNAAATETPTAAYEQMEEENSYEFEAFDGTDYRDLFLNADGTGYNEDKQSSRYNSETGQWELESSWKYDISPRVLDELKLDWESGKQEDAELGARATINNQLMREPEFLAIVVNQLSDEQKTELGLDGITTVKGMESALENEDTLAKVESAVKDMLENRAEGEFTTFTGYATNYYLRSNNEANIQNDSSNIEAARTATRYYDNVDVFIINIEGQDVIFDIDCLNVVIPVEPGTPEEEVEPGTPIITVEIDDPDPDTGNETGTETGDETGDETGSETGEETGSETGNETGDETGNETGNETGDETGNETGTETGNEGGLDPKDPGQIEDNMQTGDESTNTVTPLPAGEETDRPDTGGSEYNPDTNQFEDTDAEPERPAEDIVSEDGSGDSVAEIIDNADQTHAEDENLSQEDQQAAEAQQEANDTEITDTPEMSNDEAADWFNSQFGN